MPVILLDRLPLPSLRAYSCVSVALLSASLYYAVQMTSDPAWRNDVAAPQNLLSRYFWGGLVSARPPNVDNSTAPPNGGRALRHQLADVLAFIVQEPHCIWTVINMAYCCLLVAGRIVQRLVFGELRVSERQRVKDKFWNFVFYKFIFVFGVLNVQYMEEVLLWCSWFSALGFLQLLAQLARDRFEYLSFSPSTPVWSHIRLLALLMTVFLAAGFLLLAAACIGFLAGLNTFAFMAAECILLAIRTLHALVRYALHLYDVRRGAGPDAAWHKRGPLAYYAELGFELAPLAVDLLHHMHMLLWSNIFLSMASLVICMQLRYLFHEIRRRIRRHTNYLWVLNHMEHNYPLASPHELADNSDNCAICWEKMDTARKLPCQHLFHASCLQSWLEQDTSCPTCRLALNIQAPGANDAASRLDPLLNTDLQNDGQPPARRQPNHFFHFDGSRYVSWLPSFSVEVTHTQLLRSDQHPPTHTSQLDAMARQVQQLFPHIPLPTIVDDLRITRSVELTIENVLDGRIVVPPIYREPDTPPVTPYQPLAIDDTARNWDEVPDVPAPEPEEVNNLGSRFSKSSTERERILQRRKEVLLQTARKRFIEKQRATQRDGNS